MKKNQLKGPSYNYWHALYRAFYSSSLYNDVFKKWRGLGILYLFLVIVLGSIPLSVRIMMETNQFFKANVLFPIQALPTINIKNGMFVFDKPMPYLIKNNHNQVVSVINTTGFISAISTYPQLRVLITNNTMYFIPPSYKEFLGFTKSSSANKVYSKTLGKDANGIFDGQNWLNTSGFAKLNTVLQILVFPCITLTYLIICMLLLVVLATLAQLCSDVFFGLKITYKESCRLLSVSSTPMFTLLFLIRISNFPLPHLGLVYLVLLINYFFYALYSVKFKRD